MSEDVLQPHRHVIVVGAGAAGLAAARSLSDSNISTTVLEARSRAGGRMYTHTFPERSDKGLSEVAVDVGASILHGCGDENQYVFQLAVFNEEIAPVVAGGSGYESTYYARWYDQETGHPVSSETVVEMSGLSERVCAKMKDLQSAEEKKQMEAERNGEIFEWMTMKKAFDNSLAYVLKTLDRKLTRVEESVLHKMFVRGFAYNAPLSAIPLSTATFAETLARVEDDKNGRIYDIPLLRRESSNHRRFVNACDSPKLLKLNKKNARHPGDRVLLGGYTYFLTRRLERYLDLKFGRVVSRIRVKTDSVPLEGGHPCQVECSNGEIYPCDYVVCTLPVGVLRGKSDKSRVEFLPPLSAEKRHAISRVQGGIHNKVVLRFAPTDVFWPPNTPQINCLDARFQFFNLHAYKKTGVLIAHVFGASSFSETYDGLDDKRIVQEVLDVLNGMFFPKVPFMHRNRVIASSSQKAGISTMPQPVDSYVSRWHMDPFSLGSYSVIGIGGDWGCLEELGKPEFDGRLQFGGEHCSLLGWQCVHGAYETGIDCAIRIMDAYGIPVERRRGMCKRTLEESSSEHENVSSGSESEERRPREERSRAARNRTEKQHSVSPKRFFTPAEDRLIVSLARKSNKVAGLRFWCEQSIIRAISSQTGISRKGGSYYRRYLVLKSRPRERRDPANVLVEEPDERREQLLKDSSGEDSSSSDGHQSEEWRPEEDFAVAVNGATKGQRRNKLPFTPDEDRIIILLAQDKKWDAGRRFWFQKSVIQALSGQAGIRRDGQAYYNRYLRLKNDPERSQYVKTLLLERPTGGVNEPSEKVSREKITSGNKSSSKEWRSQGQRVKSSTRTSGLQGNPPRFTNVEDKVILGLAQQNEGPVGRKFWFKHSVVETIHRYTGLHRKPRAYYLRYLKLKKEGEKVQEVVSSPRERRSERKVQEFLSKKGNSREIRGDHVVGTRTDFAQHTTSAKWSMMDSSLMRGFTPEEDELIVLLARRNNWNTGRDFWYRKSTIRAMSDQTEITRRGRAYYERYLSLKKYIRKKLLGRRKRRTVRPASLSSDKHTVAKNKSFDEMATEPYIEEEVLEEGRAYSDDTKQTTKNANELKNECKTTPSFEVSRWSRKESRVLGEAAQKCDRRLLESGDFSELSPQYNLSQVDFRRSSLGIRTRNKALQKEHAQVSPPLPVTPKKRSLALVDGRSTRSDALTKRRVLVHPSSCNGGGAQKAVSEEPFEWTDKDKEDLLRVKLRIAGPGQNLTTSKWRRIRSEWVMGERRGAVSLENLMEMYTELRSFVTSFAESDETHEGKALESFKEKHWTLQERGVLDQLLVWFGKDRLEDIHDLWNAIDFGTQCRTVEGLQEQCSFLEHVDPQTLTFLRFGKLLVDPDFCYADALEQDVIKVWEQRKLGKRRTANNCAEKSN